MIEALLNNGFKINKLQSRFTTMFYYFVTLNAKLGRQTANRYSSLVITNHIVFLFLKLLFVMLVCDCTENCLIQHKLQKSKFLNQSTVSRIHENTLFAIFNVCILIKKMK